MKTTAKALIALLALGTSALIITAQDTGGPGPDQRPPRRPNMNGQGGPGGPGGPEGPGQRMRRPIPPVIFALDANHDGVVDAEEIANAPAALKKLDRNEDGKLTMNELMPPPPQGMGGPDDGQGQDNRQRPRQGRPGGDRPQGPPPGDQQ